MIRLNKYISDSGYCSRREADALIEQARVTVNDRPAQIGYMVQPADRIKIDGRLVKGKIEDKTFIYIALNKPVGITSTTDQSDRTNIIDYVNHPDRIFPIGRLDKQSQGLIFLTNDGDIVNKILRAGNAHQKEYIVTVNKPINDEFIKRMSAGMKLEDGSKVLPCKVVREAATCFRIVLIQGIYRQIRRMCAMLDYEVEKLERVRIMNVTLKGLPLGDWRDLTKEEVDSIKKSIKESDNREEASKIASAKPKANATRPPSSKKQRSSSWKPKEEPRGPRIDKSKPKGDKKNSRSGAPTRSAKRGKR